MVFDFAEIQRKGVLLILGQVPVAEGQHVKLIHRALNGVAQFGRDRLQEVDAGDRTPTTSGTWKG